MTIISKKKKKLLGLYLLLLLFSWKGFYTIRSVVSYLSSCSKIDIVPLYYYIFPYIFVSLKGRFFLPNHLRAFQYTEIKNVVESTVDSTRVDAGRTYRTYCVLFRNDGYRTKNMHGVQQACCLAVKR